MFNKSIIIPLLVGASMISMQSSASIDTDLLAGMKARNIGPAATSGRISDIEAVISDPNIIYASAASGGVWKSVNAGVTWQPIFDEQDYASIGAIAIYQQTPDILWVGTGEGNVRNSVSIGGGIYKSIDAGKSWSLMGLEKTERINRIALHPTNPNIAYAAAMGTLWSENQDRGIYKTVDGGKNWQKILYVDKTTGATDIKMDPSNPNKLYASMWQFKRWPYRFESGGPGSGLYVSVDGGESWQKKTEEDGLPSGDLGRITFDISESQPNTVYALVEAETSALLRSDDGGEHWRKVNESVGIADRPFYYSEIEVDPKDPDTIYNIATFLRRSIDGGKTFSQLPQIACCAAGNTIHIDNHALWINPNNPKHIILGNDGGVQITQDKGDSWRFVQNLPLSQFYHIRVDNAHPYNIYGGLQDNGSWRGPAEIWQSAGIRNVHWQEIGFGDGFDAMALPNDVTKGYSQSQGGFLSRWDLNTGEEKLIMPNSPSEDVELRFNWNAALAQDPFDDSTIYYGSQFVHKSTDKGETWTVISDDLSTNNTAWQKYKDSGGLTPDVTAAENYTAIITIAPSPVKQGVIWVGTDDGRIHVTQDGGKTWTSVESKARKAPKNAFVPHIAPSHHDAGTAYIVFDNHRKGDMKPYIFKAESFGKKFKNLTTKSLRGYTLSVQEDHVDPNLLFLGTELGLYVSTTAGKDWFKWDQGVPTVSVMDMAIQQRENDLVLGTHGRSIFVLDDYSALRGLSEKSFSEPLAVLATTDGQQYVSSRAPSSRFWGNAAYEGKNEAYGVVLTVMASGKHLPHPDEKREKARKIALRADNANKEKDDQAKDADDKLSNKARIEIRNGSGELVRTFVTKLNQGVNRIVWGLESDGAKPMPGQEPKDDKDILPAGPEVTPGTYTVKVILNEHEVETTAKVLIDPRYQVTVADLEKNYQMQHQAVDMFSTLSDAVGKLVDSKKDIELVKTMADRSLEDVKENKDDHPLAELSKSADELLKKIKELDKNLRSIPKTKGIVDDSYKVTSKVGTAWYYVGSTYGKPSLTAQKYLTAAQASLSEGVGQVNVFLNEDLTDFKKAYHASGLSLLSQTTPVKIASATK
ncbi:WD40/YVTN/BNR-like repeat-containing protein [Colwelliaceae bacterium 6471]